MPLPVIADIFQAKLKWTNANMQRPATNDLHFNDFAVTGSEASLMAALNANVTAAMWEHTSSPSSITNVLITALDGVSGTATFTPTTAAHWTGQGDVDAVPQGCAVVTIQSGLRGRSHRNRVFLPWIAEDSSTEGVLIPANTATMQAAWEAFRVAMIASSWPLVAISPKLASFDDATAVVARPYLKTQRRRARR